MIIIDFYKLTEAERAAFTAEFIRVSGFDDSDTPAPWCAPWTWCLEGVVEGEPKTPEEMARAYYASVKEEVDSELAEEAKQEEQK